MVPDQTIKLETIIIALLSLDTLFYEYTVDSDQLALPESTMFSMQLVYQNNNSIYTQNGCKT